MKRTSSKPSAKKTGVKCAVLFAVLFFSALSAHAEIVEEDIFAWWSMDSRGTEPPIKIYALPGGHSMEMPMSARRIFRQPPYGRAVSFQGGKGAAAELPKPMNAQGGVTLSLFVKIKEMPKPGERDAVIFRIHNKNGDLVDFTAGSVNGVNSWIRLRSGMVGGIGCGAHNMNAEVGSWVHLITTGYGPDQNVWIAPNLALKCAAGTNGGFRGGLGRTDPVFTNVDLTHVLIGNGYVGALDDVIVFNRGLTEEEAMRVYQGDIRKLLSVQPKGKLAETWANLKSGS